jgi:hypothetical protein
MRLEGSVTDLLGGAALPAVLVESWDAEQRFTEVLATAITDKSGKFVLSFEPSLIEKVFANRPPKVMLKLFIHRTRVAFTPANQEFDLTEVTRPVALSIKVPQANAGENFFFHMPANLQAELDSLKKHTATVMKGLEDEKIKQAFLENPAQALAAMGVSISPQLRRRLTTEPPPKSLLTPRAFRLLNGQIITPKVNINFTAGKEESDGR